MTKKDYELIAGIIATLPLTGSMVPHVSSTTTRKMIAQEFASALALESDFFKRDLFMERAMGFDETA